jgi:glycosyltransferase 2 family protein
MAGQEATTAAEPGVVGGRRSMGSLRRPLRIALVVVVVAAGAIAVATQWSDVRESIGQLSVASIVVSCVAVLCGTGLSMLAWRAVLADLGSNLPLPAAARVFFIGQLGKYVPGAVWTVVAQMELARDHGVPRRRTAAAFAVTMTIILAAGLFAAATALPLFADDAAARYRWLLALAPLIVISLHPRIANPLMAKAFQLARREPPERPLTLRAVGAAFGLAVGVWLFFGLHIAVLVMNFDVGLGRALLLSTGAFALAWCAGLLVLFLLLPAGAGAREVALVASLAPVLDSSEAIVVALVSRMFMTVGDLAWAGLAAGSVFRAKRRTVRG